MRFLQATPTTEDVEALVLEIGEACERWLAKRVFAGDVEDAELDDEEDVQGQASCNRVYCDRVRTTCNDCGHDPAAAFGL